MIFFTREIHEGYQDKSGWTRTATTKAKRNHLLYKKYFRLIQPFLPASALAFSKLPLHDCELLGCHWQKGKLSMALDTAGAFTRFPRRYLKVTFSGVREKPKRLPRKGEWWYADEFHLGSRTKFVLHVSFTSTDIEIPADEIKFKLSDSPH
jgi:hypothetical protein